MGKIFIVFIALSIVGCVQKAIPIKSQVSENIILFIKQTVLPVAFEYSSAVIDGSITPYDKEKKPMTGHPGYLHSENIVFSKMVNDYIKMKFSDIDSKAPDKIKINLSDFWLEFTYPHSGGYMTLAVLGGGEVTTIITAHIEIKTEILKDGKIYKKTFPISADDSHIQGYGTGTRTSYVHQGYESQEYKIASAINSANNKAIILLNQFIDSL
ncbi:MAG: hypothetical protein A4E71_01553 [Smithella sp. PtaU1.Bin162]|nr:MAG: hypothetical protein A4E71_01553 [Smithella sp. PtaU1.Bin162]